MADHNFAMTPEAANFSSDPGHAVITPLDHLTCIEVGGDDAQSFLQGQFTNDINEVSPAHGQLSSYCTPKGRMLAIFNVCQWQDNFLLILPADIAETTIKRLQMFVLRSKVEINTQSSISTIIGISGNAPESLLGGLNLNTPDNDYDVSCNKHSLCMKIPGVSSRYLLAGDETFTTHINDQDFSNAKIYPPSYWQWLNIMSGIPAITKVTQESFVPQMANMELINGVSFSKGCYPGQEVVARLHYLGTASRRMYRFESANDKSINAGDDIYMSDNGSNQSIGTVVSAVQEDGNKISGLAVLRVEAAQQNQLSIGSPTGLHATVLSLPYDIPVNK